jgi:NMD protein affecting ribosome stability and mRNA decay
MRRTQEQLKADLLAQAEQAIEQLIGWTDDTPQPTLAQIEEVVMRLHKQLSAQMAQAILQEQEATTQSVPGPSCPTCGREMRYKGNKAHPVESRVGTIQLQRAHYYCSYCQQGLFPPG